MYATMGDAHREWHRNAGVPMGTPGCPQDACHLPDPYCWECCDDGSDCPACRLDAPRLEALMAEPDPWPPADSTLPF